MARYLGVAITFLCFCLLGSGHFPATASDGVQSSPFGDKSTPSAVSGTGAVGIQTPARVLSVYDGDTVKVEAAMWPGLTWRGNVRVEGVDTPEIRGKCEGEKRKAVAARDFVRESVGGRITLVNVKRGKVRRARRGADQIGGRNRLDGPPDTSQTRTALRWQAASGMVWQGTEVTCVPVGCRSRRLGGVRSSAAILSKKPGPPQTSGIHLNSAAPVQPTGTASTYR